MKTPDVNVLVNSANQASPQYDLSRSWLKEATSGGQLVGFPWISLAGFLRLATSPQVVSDPLPPAKALAAIDTWLSIPGAQLVGPGRQHLSILGRLMLEHDIKGGAVTDARLAAIAIEHGATLATFDTDFHRFAELDLEYLGAR